MAFKPMVKMCPDCGQSWSRSPVEAEKKIKDRFCTHHGKKLIAIPKCKGCGSHFNPFKSDYCFCCGKPGEEILPKKYAKIVHKRKARAQKVKPRNQLIRKGLVIARNMLNEQNPQKRDGLLDELRRNKEQLESL